jgi:hypothetical protein
MSEAYGADVSVPLLASLGVVAATTAALLWRGGRFADLTARDLPFTSPARDEQELLGSWRLWALIVTVVFLLANQLLVRGVAVGRWDVDGQFYPYYVLVADHARAARFVQWDPWTNGGLPALADPQIGAFSPLTTLLGLLTGGTSTGFTIYWLLVWWLGAVGVLMLGRHLGVPGWGAGVVALGFAFCGVYTGNAEHTSWISAYSFLPLTIWRLDVSLGSRRLLPAAEAGALWGLGALAGYPGVTIITGCFAALWALGRALAPSSDSPASVSGRPGLLFVLQAVLLLLSVGCLVLSPVYLAFFLEMAGTSPRVGGVSREAAVADLLEPGALATFASPYLTSLKVMHQFMDRSVPGPELWPSSDLSMVNVYAGAIIPTLALFALLKRPRDHWRWWVAGLVLLSLACAVGDRLPLRGWLYDWLYPMRFFRHSAIFRLYFVFAVCVLALFGARDLAADLRQPSPGARRGFALAALVLTVVALVAFLAYSSPEWNAGMPETAILLGRLHFGFVWLGLAVIALIAWRWPDPSRVWRVPVLLGALAASDVLITSVLSIPTVLRVGEAADRWKLLDQRHRASLDLTEHGWLRERSSCEPDSPLVRCRRNDQLITKVPVFNAYATEKNPFHLAMIHHPVLGAMATGPERTWFASDVAWIPPTDRAFAEFRSRAEALGAPPLVVHSPDNLRRRPRQAAGGGEAEQATIAALPAAERVRADMVRYLPGELIFDVTPRSRGWLLVTDRWARSWRAEVNGQPTPVYAGNFIFRALPVEAGTNRVKFTYSPAALPWFLVLSWATLGIVGALRVRAWG